MQRQWRQIGGIVLMALVLVVGGSTAHAGGWSVVTLDGNPSQVQAGVPFTIGFRVLQHGTKPMAGLHPEVKVWSSAAQERIKVTATAEGEVGHYVATLILPAAGTWTWEIAAFGQPAPMSPLQVAVPVAPAAPATRSLIGVQPLLLGLGAMLVLTCAMSAVMYSRRRRIGVSV